jgi:hypothetical protein
MNSPHHPLLFISYRREDSEGWAGRVAEQLQAAFDEWTVFFDYDSIVPASKWNRVIETAIKDCRLLLVIIGPRWVSIADANGQPRLHAPDDLVRFELTVALKRHIPILPLLVGKASLPMYADLPEELQGLLDHQAIELPAQYWKQAIDELVRTTGRIIGVHPKSSSSAVPPTVEVAEELSLSDGTVGSIVGVRASAAQPQFGRTIVGKKAKIRRTVMKDIVGLEISSKRDT